MSSAVHLSQEQTQALHNARRVLATIKPDLDKLRDCGVDCQAELNEYERLDTGLSKIVQHFGVQGMQ